MKTHLSVFYLFILLFSCSRIAIEQKDVLDSSIMTKSSVFQAATDYGEFMWSDDYSDAIQQELENGIVVISLSDSLFLFEGDMLFTENNISLLEEHSSVETSQNRSSTIMRTSNPWAHYWTGNVIPYAFNSNFPSSYREKALAAMDEISEELDLTFCLRTNESNYIVFNHSTVNNSYVGKIGGAQTINIVSNHKGVIMHEIMHALGFYHEQSRNDRDSYITINWSNIKPDKQHNFSCHNSGTDLAEFDFNSIMLYSSYISDTSFVYSSTTPVMTKLDGSTFVGQRNGLSQGDINGLLTVYGSPYCKLARQTEVLQDGFQGSTEIYEAWETTTLNFYTDNSFANETILFKPRVVNVRKTTITCQDHQAHYDYQTITVTLNAGQHSYILDDRRNYEMDIQGTPYEIDIVYYTLLD